MDYKTKEKINIFILILPWLIVLLIFWLEPLIYSGYLSLTDYKTLTNKSNFIGLANYSKMFKDELFWKSLWNTTYFTLITVPVTLSISLVLAEVINNKVKKLRTFLQSTYFLPSITSLVVVSLIFTNLYSQNGYIYSLLKMLNLTSSNNGLLLNQSTAMNSIIAMDVWLSVGYYMVLFLAGMQTISVDLYDNAKLSGASFWQQFRYITLPGLKNTIAFVLMIDLIKSFQIFIEILIMTKGGPLNSTTTMVYYIFDNAFNKADMMGYASAIAYFLFFVLLIFSFVQFKLAEKR
ncbi:MAG: carbohydrate ABC transporter permease [Candidatus Kapaibacteriota bacterium]